MDFNRREPYENNTTIDYSTLKHFFAVTIEFDKENKEAHKVIEEIDEEKTYVSRVWLLFASNDSQKWDCVQVAQSRENVQSEIESAIEFLYVEFKPIDTIEYKNSAFYKNVCPSSKGTDTRELLYSKIGNEYSRFKFCLLNVDAYLGIGNQSTDNKNDAELIMDICKNQYAEAKIAYQTLAIYWRLTSSGVDGQTIQYIADNKLSL